MVLGWVSDLDMQAIDRFCTFHLLEGGGCDGDDVRELDFRGRGGNWKWECVFFCKGRWVSWGGGGGMVVWVRLFARRLWWIVFWCYTHLFKILLRRFVGVGI